MNLPIGLLTLFFVVGFPCFTLYFMLKKVPTHGANPEFFARFSSLFFTLNLKARYALYQLNLFLFRRFLLAIVVVFFRSHPFPQFFTMYLSTNLFILLLVVHPPLATPLMNRVELINEYLVFSCSLILFGFTDYAPEGMQSTP